MENESKKASEGKIQHANIGTNKEASEGHLKKGIVALDDIHVFMVDQNRAMNRQAEKIKQLSKMLNKRKASEGGPGPSKKATITTDELKLDTHLFESDHKSGVSRHDDQDRFMDERNQNIGQEEATGFAINKKMVIKAERHGKQSTKKGLGN